MDAYDLGNKITKYWAALYPKNSGEIAKPKSDVRVYVTTPDGQRQVVGVRIDNDKILLITDGE
jgi:hypothetical protein